MQTKCITRQIFVSNYVIKLHFISIDKVKNIQFKQRDSVIGKQRVHKKQPHKVLYDDRLIHKEGSL